MSLSETLAPLAGRLAFGWFFLMQVANYANRWTDTVLWMHAQGIPAAPFLLLVSLVILTMGAISLIFGYHARYGALFLFVITAIATVTLHAYWRIYDDPALRAQEFQLFSCYAAISGALLMLVGMGPGPVSVDNTGGKKR